MTLALKILISYLIIGLIWTFWDFRKRIYGLFNLYLSRRNPFLALGDISRAQVTNSMYIRRFNLAIITLLLIFWPIKLVARLSLYLDHARRRIRHYYFQREKDIQKIKKS